MTTNTLHAHVDTAASDCDGPLYTSRVETMTDAEKANEYGDYDFKRRVLGNNVSFHSEGGVKVLMTEYGFTMEEPTEEGYRSAEVRWCEDEDCDPDARWQRDVFAEQMGY